MKKSLIVLWILPAVCLLCLAGCGKKPIASQNPEKPVSAQQVSSGKTANGSPVTLMELSCEGKKKWLIVVGEVKTCALATSSALAVNGTPVFFNPVIAATEVFLFDARSKSQMAVNMSAESIIKAFESPTVSLAILADGPQK